MNSITPAVHYSLILRRDQAAVVRFAVHQPLDDFRGESRRYIRARTYPPLPVRRVFLWRSSFISQKFFRAVPDMFSAAQAAAAGSGTAAKTAAMILTFIRQLSFPWVRLHYTLGKGGFRNQDFCGVTRRRKNVPKCPRRSPAGPPSACTSAGSTHTGSPHTPAPWRSLSAACWMTR